MAITNTALTSGTAFTVSSGQATASISPTGDRLVIVALGVNDADFELAEDFALSGGGMTTWRLLSAKAHASASCGVVIFAAMQSSPGSGTISITWQGGEVLAALAWSVSEFAGLNTGGSNGSLAIRNFIWQAGGPAATSFVGDLPTFGSANNGAFQAVVHEIAEATATDAQFTEIHDLTESGGSDALGMATAFRADDPTSWGATWATSDSMSGFLVELVEAGEDGIEEPTGEMPHLYVEENNAMIGKGSGNQHIALAVPGPALKASTKYLVVARALMGGASMSVRAAVKLRTADETSFDTKADHWLEPNQTGADRLAPYFFAHSFTTSATPSSVTLEYDTQTGSSFARVDQMSILLLDLDDIGTEGTDYWEDIQADPGDGNGGDEYSTSAETTVIAQLLGSDLGTAEHVVFGYGRCHVGSTGRWFRHDLFGCYDEATAVSQSYHQSEGEDSAEERISGFAIRHKASSGTPNVTLYGSEEAANGNMWDGGGYLIALPTALFDDFEEDYTAAAMGVGSTEDTIASVGPYTPTTNGNHMVFGCSTGSGPNNQIGGCWVDETTTEIRVHEATISQGMKWDGAKDFEIQSTFQRYSISSEVTLNLQSVGIAGGTFNQEMRRLIAVNLAVDAGPPPTLAPQRLSKGVGI